MHAKDPKGKDYTRKFVSGTNMKGLILSHMAVFLPSSLLLLLSLIKLWARWDRGVTHRENRTPCSDLMLPGLTLVYFLRPKKRTKTLIQDKLLQPGSVTSLVLLFILEKRHWAPSHLPFSLVSPTISPLRILLVPLLAAMLPIFAAQKIRTKGKDLFFFLL